MNAHTKTFTTDEPKGLAFFTDVDVTDAFMDSDMFSEEGEEEATAFLNTDDECARFVWMRVQDHSVDLTYWMNRDQAIAAMGKRFVDMTEDEASRDDSNPYEHHQTWGDVL